MHNGIHAFTSAEGGLTETCERDTGNKTGRHVLSCILEVLDEAALAKPDDGLYGGRSSAVQSKRDAAGN